MTPEKFKSGVDKIGATLRSFDQSDIVDKRVYMDAGACYAFCLVWIARLECKATARAVPNQDQVVEDVSWLSKEKHDGNLSSSSELYMRGNGLRPDGKTANLDVNWNKLWFFLSAQQGFYVLGATPAVGDGHAIGFSTRNGAAIMFDPNFGEVTFQTSDDMKNFFGAYWPRAYPNLARNVGGVIERFR